MKKAHYLSCITLAAAAILSGCGSVSGLDASDKFSCAAPDGVTCMSVSGIYANANANNLPGMRTDRGKVDDDKGSVSAATESKNPTRDYGAPVGTYAMVGGTEKTSPKTMTAPNSGMPLRTPERILRVWLAPFEDQDRDLHDQKYFYVTVNSGQWTIEANQERIRSRYQRVSPLSSSNPANAVREEPASPQQQAAQMLPVSGVQQPHHDGAED